MRRLVASAVIVAFVAAACSSEPRSALEGFRDLPERQVLKYRVEIFQTRTASGLGDPKQLATDTILDLEEEVVDDRRYAVVVRRAEASGEESQRVAAQRLTGRRLIVDLDRGALIGVPEAFSGTEDVAAADVAMLSVLFAPVLPNPRVDAGDGWRARTPTVALPWAQGSIAFTLDHRVRGRATVRGLDAVGVDSTVLGNLRFPLPIVTQPSGAPATRGSRELVINRLFDDLFADVDDPVHGLAAAIAAIPLAIVAPFVAIGEALGGLFGGSSSKEPAAPVVDLSGPIELTSATALWAADGRVLEATGEGTMALSGRIPRLPGEAAQLTGKTLKLDARWKLKRTLTSPWPEPRDPPGRGPLPFVALAAGIVAAAAALVRFPLRRR